MTNYHFDHPAHFAGADTVTKDQIDAIGAELSRECRLPSGTRFLTTRQYQLVYEYAKLCRQIDGINNTVDTLIHSVDLRSSGKTYAVVTGKVSAEEAYDALCQYQRGPAHDPFWGDDEQTDAQETRPVHLTLEAYRDLCAHQATLYNQIGTVVAEFAAEYGDKLDALHAAWDRRPECMI